MHCNGDDPEAVVHCAKIAIEFRQKFNKDVVIDMICYRRFGHSERAEEHTSELQSRTNLVCRLLLEKKKNNNAIIYLHVGIHHYLCC